MYHVFCREGTRQIDADRRAIARLTIDLYVAARLLDETVDHGESEPRPLAVRLGGKEGIEHFRQDIRCHADAGIADRQHDILPRLHIEGLARIFVVQEGVSELDGEDRKSTRLNSSH